ncbi:MAG: hypothetical protein WCH58_02910 [Candidatus Saccharibacteria bacterium]|jgi:hypothetical protein
MEDSKVIAAVHEFSASSKHRFLLMITMSVIISIILVIISMAIYNSSGAAQLDLSRPGYQSVRSQAVTDDSDFQNYTAGGVINQSTISEFKTLYAGQATKTKSIDAFGSDPLSPDALGLTVITN